MYRFLFLFLYLFCLGFSGVLGSMFCCFFINFGKFFSHNPFRYFFCLLSFNLPGTSITRIIDPRILSSLLPLPQSRLLILVTQWFEWEMVLGDGCASMPLCNWRGLFQFPTLTSTLLMSTTSLWGGSHWLESYEWLQTPLVSGAPSYSNLSC